MKKLLTIKKFLDAHPLSKKHKLKAYYRFLSWQISQFLFPGERVVPFTGNTKLVVKKGLTGATGNIYTGLHEFSDMSFLLHFLRQEDLFFDIGANVGSYTILASGYVRANTIAIEPIPETFTWLLKNIKLNNIENRVTAKNIGLGADNKKLYFTSSYNTVNHVASPPEIEGDKNILEVEVETFDSLVDTTGVPVLVKIDVEGYETEVINGMKRYMQSTMLKAIIIELNGSGFRYGYDEAQIHKYLMENDFSPYQYDPFLRSLLLIEEFGTHNTIYIRDIAFVEDRIEKAEKINVFSESF